MNLQLQKFNHFFIGFLPGLLLPPLFMWLYLEQFSPFDTGFFATIKALYPSVLLGKLLLLSAFPNLALVFLFYKTDSFKMAIGIMTSAMPYMISSFFML
jgi:hypothetical protein